MGAQTEPRFSRGGGEAIELALGYGPGTLSLRLPGRRPPVVLEPEVPASLDEPAKILRRALDQPIGSPPLRELARGRRSAAILVPGKTRISATAETVPVLLDELRAAGLDEDAVSIYLATGTHEHHAESDLPALVGARAAARVRCLGHPCKDPEAVEHLGTTRRGTPVAVNRGVLASELKILTGRIVPHYFAGFAGGRKAVIPGVAAFETIQANHRLTLAAESGIHPAVAPCSLAENPVHLDMLEAAAMARPDFCLNTVLDTRGRLLSAFAGHWQRAHEVGCREVADRFQLRLREPVDLLVTSPGGLPHDCNFMQSIKAVLNLQSIVRRGGSILWIAQAAGALHPGFRDWAAIADDDELERAVRENYTLTGHNSIMLRRLARKVRIHLKSELPAEDVERFGFHAVDSAQDALDAICAELPEDFRCAVAPCANVICAALEDASEASEAAGGMS